MWIVRHVPEGKKREIRRDFVKKSEFVRYVSLIGRPESLKVVEKDAWAVWRMRRYGKWSLVKVVDSHESMARLIRKMRNQIITVKGGRV